MPPRPRKPSAATSKLLEAVRFLSGITKDEGPPNECHILLSNKTATAFNGTVGAGCKIDEDLYAAPNAKIFLSALSKCGDNYTLTQVDTKLVLKSGPFKANIPCIDPTLMYFPTPDPNMAPIDDSFKKAVELIEKVKPENGQRVVTLSFLLNGPSILATDGKILIEAWHGLNMPTNIPVPKAIIPSICNTKKLTGFGLSNTTVTFFFEDESFIRSQLFADKWPDVSHLIDRPSNMKPVPKDLFKALDAIKDFSGNGFVYFNDGKLQSHEISEKGAEFDVEGLRKGPVYSVKYLNLIKDMIDKVDFYVEPEGLGRGKICAFVGNNVRGILMGYA